MGDVLRKLWASAQLERAFLSRVQSIKLPLGDPALKMAHFPQAVGLGQCFRNLGMLNFFTRVLGSGFKGRQRFGRFLFRIGNGFFGGAFPPLRVGKGGERGAK